MASTDSDRFSAAVRPIVEPLLSSLALDLYDVQAGPQLVRILVDGPDGVSSDDLAKATRIISHRLDEDDPIPGAYTLEVSSPGVERPLRTPQHFQTAVGEPVTIKCGPSVEGDRRVTGTLSAADDQGVRVALDTADGGERALDYRDISKARTTFSWDAAGSSTRKASRT